MTTKNYRLTDEHRAQLTPWADRWIANALSTAPTTDEDRAITRSAIRGLYEAANLEPPPDHRIVFVASPFIMRFAGGFAAAIWWLRGQNASGHAATRDATAATTAATAIAAFDATLDATTRATRDATEDATRTLHDIAWWRVPLDAFQRAATALLGPEYADFGLRCAENGWRLWSGGNQYSAWCATISFFRHIAKLDLDYSKWQHYETAALHSGPRMMHSKFCLVSDRPVILTQDALHRPHNATGPFCRWSDGSALYAWHGTRVPAWIIERPQDLTATAITAEPNAEVRRAMVAIMGAERYVRDLGVPPLDVCATPLGNEELYRIPRPDDTDLVLARVINSTPEVFGSPPSGDHVVVDARWYKRYWLRVPPPTVAPEITTVQAAKAWSFGMHADDYQLTVES